jgi:hypothetical protein
VVPDSGLLFLCELEDGGGGFAESLIQYQPPAVKTINGTADPKNIHRCGFIKSPGLLIENDV